MGLDPQTQKDEVHEIVGVQLQAGALPPKLRVGEILDMYAVSTATRPTSAS